MLQDYWLLVKTRNWYNGFILGYLYHKLGQECWLDAIGHCSHRWHDWMKGTEDWSNQIINDLQDRLLPFSFPDPQRTRLVHLFNRGQRV